MVWKERPQMVALDVDCRGHAARRALTAVTKAVCFEGMLSWADNDGNDAINRLMMGLIKGSRLRSIGLCTL